MRYCFNCLNEIAPGDKSCPFCHKSTSITVPEYHLLPGTVLNGNILIGASLGEGGFGITYMGLELDSGTKVAVKEFFPGGYVNRNNSASASITCSKNQDRSDFFEKGRERFLKEARILAKFSGERGVVSVKSFFEANNTAYIVMEYLEGMDLKEYIKQNGVMSADHAIDLLLPLMYTLSKIHSQDLIHRDISPDNIRLVLGGLKLLDFGAARDVSADANKSLSVMLKPGYAPEEQYRTHGEQGPWTDIYALCATLYKCITGITPPESNERIFNDTLKRPSELGISIKPEIETALMKGLAVAAADRYQSIGQLIDDITDKSATMTVADRSTQTVTVNPDVSAQAFDQSIHTENAGGQKRNKGSAFILILVLIALICGIGFAIYYFSQGNDDGPDDKTVITTENDRETASPEDTSSADSHEQTDKTDQTDDTADSEGPSPEETGVPFLGISFALFEAEDAYTLYNSNQRGVYIMSVIKGYNDKYIKKGDKIESANSTAINTADDLLNVFTQCRIGDTISVVIQRNGKRTVTQLTVFAKPEADYSDPIEAQINVKDYGTITLELYPHIAPETVSYFVELAEGGYYDGLPIFHVFDDYYLGFGDYYGVKTGNGPATVVEGEFSDNGFYNPLSNTKGVIAMSKAKNPLYSDPTGIFIWLSDECAYDFDGKYAAFGAVVDGFDVLEALVAVQTQYDEEGIDTGLPVNSVIIESLVIN
ncbi:MAG: PDZ domain-containing protein [Ruminococcaceae bacterium]|nr:PDZ domain-containing protein [Oscillospiraceae bacterium]